jgi:hypothetical protein
MTLLPTPAGGDRQDSGDRGGAIVRVSNDSLSLTNSPTVSVEASLKELLAFSRV